jgi:hypothetical protein
MVHADHYITDAVFHLFGNVKSTAYVYYDSGVYFTVTSNANTIENIIKHSTIKNKFLF